MNMDVLYKNATVVLVHGAWVMAAVESGSFALLAPGPQIVCAPITLPIPLRDAAALNQVWGEATARVRLAGHAYVAP